MFCPNCGTAVPSNTSPCPHCQESFSDANNVTPIKPANDSAKAGNVIAVIFSIIIIFVVMIIVFAGASS